MTDLHKNKRLVHHVGTHFKKAEPKDTRRQMLSNIKLAPLMGAFLFCVVWEDLIHLLEIPIYVLPAPSDVINVALKPESRELLYHATIQTGMAAFLGFSLAVFFGVLTGTLLASVRLLRIGVYPLANLLQMVPIIAIAPLLNIWFGYGVFGVAASAMIVSIFPVIANTVDGFRSIDPQLIELFNVYGARPAQRWRSLELPAALPQIFTGFRVAAGLAVIGAVVGELVSGVLKSPPIGAVIASNLRTGKLDVVFAAIVCSAFVGFSLFGLVSWAGQKMMGGWNSSKVREELDLQTTEKAKRADQVLLTTILIGVALLSILAFSTQKTGIVTQSDQSSISTMQRSESKGIDSDSSLTDQSDLKEIRLQLNWVPEPEFGGIFEAKRLGLDRAHGFNLKIISGGPGTPSAQLIAQKKIEFGVVDGTQIMSMRAKGAALVGIYASFKTDPRAIITHRKDAPKDLRTLWQSDRLLAVEPGSLFMKWLSHHYGESALTWVSTQGGLAQFKMNPRLSQGVYVFSEPVSLKLDGIDTHIFPISESGFNPYAVVVATHQDLIKERPRLINSLDQILRQGWRSYLKDPSPTNKELSRLNPAMSFDAMQLAVEYAKPFITGEAGSLQGDPQVSHETALGKMDFSRWSELREQLFTLKVLEDKSQVKPNECFWSPSNTNFAQD